MSRDPSDESTLSNNSENSLHKKSRSKDDILDDDKIEQGGHTNHMNDENESVDSKEFDFIPKMRLAANSHHGIQARMAVKTMRKDKILLNMNPP